MEKRELLETPETPSGPRELGICLEPQQGAASVEGS